MADSLQQLIPGEFFHLYNRAVGNELLFQNDEDYTHWLHLLKKFISPVCEIHAYCLLPNHYHLLIRVNYKTGHSIFSKRMSDAANAFVKWKNLKYHRKGGLFMTPFKRKLIKDENYLIWCLWYIHRNPLHHGYTIDWQNWKYSSYKAYIINKHTLITKEFFITLFGGPNELVKYHLIQADDSEIQNKISLE